MTPQLNYQDTATFFDVSLDGYGDEVPALETDVPALYVQVTGREHGSGQENVTSASVLHLDPTSAFLIAKQYRLEGLVVRVNPFGAVDSSQLFRITNVTVARDVLLDNEVHNIECELDKVGDFVS